MGFLHQDVLLEIIDSTFMTYYATISYQKFRSTLWLGFAQYWYSMQSKGFQSLWHTTAPTKDPEWIDFVVDCGFSTALICAYPKIRFISITGWIYLICGFR